MVSAIGVVAAFILINIWIFFAYGKQYKEECKVLVDSEIGDEVLWGHFDIDTIPGKDRVKWIVVEKDGTRVRLLTEEGIGGYWYNQKYESVSWEDSDLREHLNSKAYMGMFSKYEMKNIVPIDDDYISLLTTDEAMDIFPSDVDRELKITDEALSHNTNINTLSKVNQWDMKGYRSSWWWLKGQKGVASIYAPVVTVDGKIEEQDKEVNRTGGAIRPAIWVDIGSGV